MPHAAAPPDHGIGFLLQQPLQREQHPTASDKTMLRRFGQFAQL
ncbi:hypothetical protein H206_05393 [Candidatus Electrothrix aarhusensis]|uniref:Uncharacterized protein n=1 Tax=Candidatus Electrothrix aarhusensis TaxID=1859131 RepID=A0A3S3RU42_9BACT|nr:hypothetical protein H206_05393 [Candidatus Electrothrix aarhusensis]